MFFFKKEIQEKLSVVTTIQFIASNTKMLNRFYHRIQKLYSNIKMFLEYFIIYIIIFYYINNSAILNVTCLFFFLKEFLISYVFKQENQCSEGICVFRNKQEFVWSDLDNKLPIILDVEYSQYIHFVFTIWVCYFIFYCSILFTTFVGARAIYTICIRPWFVGLARFFVRKYIFFNKFFIFNFSINILRFSYLISFQYLDKGLFELVGPYGAIRNVSKMARRVKAMQTGLLYHNTGIVLLGALFLFMFATLILNI